MAFRDMILTGFNTGLPLGGYSPYPSTPMTQPTGESTSSWWQDLIFTGLGIYGALGYPGLPRATQTGFMPSVTPAGGIIGPVAGALSRTEVVAALAALGIKVVGNVARATAAMLARIPAWLKTAAAAVGISIGLDELGDIFGNGEVKKRRRGKGITATELRGFRKVGQLLRSCGMRPKLGARPHFHAHRRRKCATVS